MVEKHDSDTRIIYEDDKYSHLIGRRFGRLTVLHVYHKKDGRNSRLILVFRCDCGKEVCRRYDSTKAFKSSSCGCANHKLSRTKLYYVWKDIKNRCYSKNVDAYKWYGARGIGMCDEWRNDPVAFIEWCKSNGYKPGLQIDRRDNNKGYSPENCRFVSCSENQRNTSANLRIEFAGETLTLVEWCEKLGRPYNLIYGRIRKGWTVEKAFMEPVDNSQRRVLNRDSSGRASGIKISYNGEEHTCLEWSRIIGVPWWTISNRVRLGWNVERIFNTPIRKKEKTKNE